MNQSNKKTDNSFNSFAFGVAVGVGAALLFGTEEGRKLGNKIIDAIPDKFKQASNQDIIKQAASIVSPTETVHQTTYVNEPPPPPAPHVRPSRPGLVE